MFLQFRGANRSSGLIQLQKNRAETAGSKYDLFWGVGYDKRGKFASPNPKSCRIQISWDLGRQIRKVPAKISSGSPGARFQKSENVIREIAFENRAGSRSRFCCVLGLFWKSWISGPPPTPVFGKSQFLQLLCENIGELQMTIPGTIQKACFAIPRR